MTRDEWQAEEEINRLQRLVAEKDDEIQRLREIESAAREYAECYQRSGDLRTLRGALGVKVAKWPHA